MDEMRKLQRDENADGFGVFTQERPQKTMRHGTWWQRASPFVKGAVGAAVGIIVTLAVAGLCYVAYQDHLMIRGVVAYINQVNAAQQKQQRPAPPAAPATEPDK